jgi:hypothetical protein
MEAIVDIRIADRKGEGYPTTHHSVVFDGDLDSFEEKVDAIIDRLGHRKVDVYIDSSEEFNDDELETLEEKGFIIG